MPSAWVITPGATVRAAGQSLIVTREDEMLQEIEIIHLDRLMLVGRVNITTPALGLLLDQDIPVTLLRRNGQVRGHMIGPTDPRADLRLGQYMTYSDPATRLAASRRIVRRKLQAMNALIGAWASNHPGLGAANEQVSRIRAAVNRVDSTESIESLLGLEGSASAAYWKVFQRVNRSALRFTARRSRPPADELNALLSLGYAFLRREIVNLLEARGLDPHVGMYHTLQSRRPALALDVMEPYRHLIVDRLVLSSVNRGAFPQRDFQRSDDGYRLETEAMRRFIAGFEDTMLDPPDREVAGESPHAGDVRAVLRDRVDRLAVWFRSVAVQGGGTTVMAAA
ncbi:MAG: CRISPR-associated endonuclease Cas1 [Phycisphaerales bacterium]|nr:CRISPR-associated endonuclease Cas1 [Phycisphaerales bacterium]